MRSARYGQGVNRPAARQASLREHNLALVARAVVDAPTPPSRADVATATGLTRATVSALVDLLTGAGILAELPPAAPLRAGRPAVPLVAAHGTIVGLGLEVNVDYLGARVLDLAGQTVAERIVAGDFHECDPAQALARLGSIAAALAEEVRVGGMRIAGARLALPGLIDIHTGRLQVAPNLGWTDLDPVPQLGLGPIPVVAANEAKLAALAQLDDAPPTYLYVSGDVGIGSAIVVDGGLFTGAHGWSGEIGHVVVDPAGPPCRCGSRGCLEQYAGKDALWQAAGADRSISAHELRVRADDGDRATREALHRAGAALGSALADYINLVDIDTILLGGFYGPLLPLLRASADRVLARRALAAPWTTIDLRAAPVDDHAALTGGAQTVLREVIDHPSRWLTL